MRKSELSTTSTTAKKSTEAKAKVGPRFELSRKEKNDLRDAFDLFDVNGTGYIEVMDLKVAIRALGYEPGKEAIKAMMSTIEKPQEGKISFSDFINLMTLKMKEKDPEEDVIKSFRLLSRNQANTLNFDNLKEVADLLDENLNDEELHEMIEAADTDGDGEVTMNDFITFMSHSSLLGEY